MVHTILCSHTIFWEKISLNIKEEETQLVPTVTLVVTTAQRMHHNVAADHWIEPVVYRLAS